MSDITEARDTFIGNAEDTETFEVSLRTAHGETVMSPASARELASQLEQAAIDAEENLREWTLDERARWEEADDEITDHTGPNLVIEDTDGVSFAQVRAPVEATMPPVTRSMRPQSAETGVQAPREGGTVSDASQGVLGGAILRALDGQNNGGGGDAA